MSRVYELCYKREVVNGKALVAVIGVLFFILATALGAYVRIPIAGSPVPITLQTFFVILSGAVLGKRLGLYSQLGYILLGSMGLPIFQGAAFGVSSLLGPTGGYLAGFAVAAYLVGRLTNGVSDTRRALLSFAIGSLVIYAFGVSWLVYIYRVNLMHAISIGMLPFIPGDIVKISFAAIIYSRISQRSKSVFSA